jgi:hypothetical protein
MQRLSIITNTDNFDVSASGRTFPTRQNKISARLIHTKNPNTLDTTINYKLRISSVDIFSKIPIRYYTEMHIGEATPFSEIGESLLILI